MGPKVTVNSAGLMNKGLELIEAHHLFGVPAEKLEVVVHPQSIVHGLVAFSDGSVTAGLAPPDMRVPIAHCLGLSRRAADDARAAARFRADRLADLRGAGFRALSGAQTGPGRAGAWAVDLPTSSTPPMRSPFEAFLDRRISFSGIARHVAEALRGRAAGRLRTGAGKCGGRACR